MGSSREDIQRRAVSRRGQPEWRCIRPEGGSGQPITADCPQRARQCPLIPAQVPGSQNPSLLCLERSPRGQLSRSSALRFYHFLQKVSPHVPNCGSSRLRFVTKLRLFPTLLSSQSLSFKLLLFGFSTRI